MNTRRHTRRRFLGTSLATITATALTARAGAAEPTHDIIDTHTHFYDPSRPQGVPWPREGSAIYRPVLPDEFVTLTEPLGVTGTVVVEASKWIEDNQWLLDLAKRHTVIKGIVGRLDPTAPTFGEHVQRFAKDPLFRGIRNKFESVRRATEDPATLLAYKRLADADLSLDINGGGWKMLAPAAALAKRLPSLRIVLDHCANARPDGNPPDRNWLAGLAQVAPHRNIYMKVSALVEGTGAKNGDAPKDLDFYRPTLDPIYEAFGPERVIYGSNWPVCLRGGSYATVLNLVKTYFAEKGADGSRRYFADNAKKAYKWVTR